MNEFSGNIARDKSNWGTNSRCEGQRSKVAGNENVNIVFRRHLC